MEDEDGTLNKRGEAYCACRYLACGRKFKSLKSLEQHLISYHNITWEAYARYSPSRHHETIEESVDDQLLGKRKDAYCMCTYMECGRKFKMLKSLEEHVTLYHNISWQLYTQYYHRSVRKPGEETTKSKSPKAEKKEANLPSTKSPKSSSPRGSGGWYPDTDSSSYVPVTMAMPIAPSVPGSPVVSFMPPSSTTYIPTQYPYMTAQVPLVPTIIQYQPMLTPPMLGYAPPSSIPISPGYYGQPALPVNTVPDSSPWLHQMSQQDSGILNLSCPKVSNSSTKEHSPKQAVEPRGKPIPSSQQPGSSFSSSLPVNLCRRYSNGVDFSQGFSDLKQFKDHPGVTEKTESAKKALLDNSKCVIVIEPDDQFDEKLSRDPGYLPTSVIPDENKSTQIGAHMYGSFDQEACNSRNRNLPPLKTMPDERNIPRAFHSNISRPCEVSAPITHDSQSSGVRNPFTDNNLHSAIRNIKYSHCDDNEINRQAKIQKRDSPVVRDDRLDEKFPPVRMPEREELKVSEDVMSQELRRQCNKASLENEEGKTSDNKPHFKPTPVLNHLTPVDYSNFRSGNLPRWNTIHPATVGRRIRRSASLPNLQTHQEEEITCDVKPVCIDLTTEELQSQNIPREDLASCKDNISMLMKQHRWRGKKLSRFPRKFNKSMKQIEPLLATNRKAHWMRSWWGLHMSHLISRKYMGFRKKNLLSGTSAKALKSKILKNKLRVKNVQGKRKASGSCPHGRAAKAVKYLFDIDCDNMNESVGTNELNRTMLDRVDIKEMAGTKSPESTRKKERVIDDAPEKQSTRKIPIMNSPEPKSDFAKRERDEDLNADFVQPKRFSPSILNSESFILSAASQSFAEVQSLKELADTKFRCLLHSTSDQDRLLNYTKSLVIPHILDRKITFDPADIEQQVGNTETHSLPLSNQFTPSSDSKGRPNECVQYSRRLPIFVSTGEVNDVLSCKECGVDSLSNSKYLKHRFECHSAMKCLLCEKYGKRRSHVYRYPGTLARHLMVDHGLATALNSKDWVTQNSYAGFDLEGVQAIPNLDKILLITDNRIFLSDSILSYKLFRGFWTKESATDSSRDVLPPSGAPKQTLWTSAVRKLQEGGPRPLVGWLYPNIRIQINDVQRTNPKKMVRKKDEGAFEQSTKVKS